MAYRRPGAGRVDFVATAMPGGEVQLRVVGRPPIRGSKISVRLGVPDVKYLVTKARRASSD